MTGYKGDSERAEAAMCGGFYHTGDVASRNGDGYLTYDGVTDRSHPISPVILPPAKIRPARASARMRLPPSWRHRADSPPSKLRAFMTSQPKAIAVAVTTKTAVDAVSSAFSRASLKSLKVSKVRRDTGHRPSNAIMTTTGPTASNALHPHTLRS